MTPFLGELIGTALLLFIGNGVVANVVLSETKGNNSGWIVITMGWGLAVFVAVFTTAAASGALVSTLLAAATAQTHSESRVLQSVPFGERRTSPKLVPTRNSDPVHSSPVIEPLIPELGCAVHWCPSSEVATIPFRPKPQNRSSTQTARPMGASSGGA